MSLAKFGAEIWRDYVTDGVPASGAWDVVKADMRAWMAAVEGELGVVNYIAAGWQTATAYAIGDVVWHGGVDYRGFAGHTSGPSTEPGVGVDWETVWQLFAADINPSGSAALPGIAFGADLDTGLFRSAADVLGITAGGVAAAYFSSAGAIIPQGKSLAFQDTNVSHSLLVQFGSNLSANRVLSLLTGDNSRTINISAANLTLSAFGASLIDDAAASNARATLGSTTVGDAVFIAASAAAARTAIGAVIGTDVQPWDANLDQIAALTPTDGNLIVGNGSAWVAESGATARTSLGLGTGNSPQFTAIQLGHASDTTLARVSAGVVSIEGSNILVASGLGSITQAWDATLASIAALGTAADRIAYTTGVDTWAETPLTAFGRSLIDDAAASNARTTLGLVIGTDVQASDVMLDSLAALNDPNADRISFWDDSAGNLAWLALAGGASIATTTLRIHESLVIAVSDEATPLTAGAGKITFRMPYGFTLTAVRASLTTAQASGSIFTVDINEGGATILSTKLTIDNIEKTSTTAATPAVISDASLANDAEMTIDIDQIGDGTATGLKVYLIGYRP